MKKIWHWIAKEEPLFALGILAGVAVFLVVRYGTANALAVVQAGAGLLPILVSLIARQWVTSPASRKRLTDGVAEVDKLPQIISDVSGIRNDLTSLTEKIGPLPKTGGWQSVAAYLAKQVEGHLADVAALGEAIKADIEDLWNQKAAHVEPVQPALEPAAPVPSQSPVSFDPPATTTTQAPVTTTPAPEPAPTVAEPAPADTTAEPDHTASLAAAAADLGALLPQ